MEIRMGLIMGGKPAVAGTIEVRAGDWVEPGQTLLNTETGKGNQPFKSMVSGRITRIRVEEGSQVRTGDVLFEYEEADCGNGTYGSNGTDGRESGGAEHAGDGQDIKRMDTEVAVIGGGPGGYVTALYAAGRGLRVVLIEKDQLGGTCLNRGCIPTKTLLQSAHLYDALRRSGEFGISANQITVDMDKVFDRKDRICGENRRGISFLLDSSHVTVITGTAQVMPDRTVVVKDGNPGYEIRAGHVVLATGSRPVMPDWARTPVCMDSREALDSRTIPRSLVIIGAGVIGMEFAFLYAAFGCRVHVIEYMDHMLGNTDAQACAVIAEAAKEKGIRVDLSSRVTRVLETDSREAVVFYEKDGAEHAANAQKVLVAVGRAPEMDREALELAGIRFDKKGIGTDENLETSMKGVYAIGDVNGRIQLAHAASAQGIQVIDRILAQKNRETGGMIKSPVIREPVIPSVIFTSPEIGSVGKSEEQCREENIKVKVSVFPFTANGKAKIQGETEGFVKLIMEEQSRRIIGGVVTGPDASALVGCIAVAITNNLTDDGLSKTVFAHPTTSEAVWEAAMGLSTGCIHYHE